MTSPASTMLSGTGSVWLAGPNVHTIRIYITRSGAGKDRRRLAHDLDPVVSHRWVGKCAERLDVIGGRARRAGAILRSLPLRLLAHFHLRSSSQYPSRGPASSFRSMPRPRPWPGCAYASHHEIRIKPALARHHVRMSHHGPTDPRGGHLMLYRL